MITAAAYVPETVTKELKINRLGDKRRIRLSSNFLAMMGFEKGQRHDTTPISGMGGFDITCNPEGRHQIYQRSYASRRNNPFETQIDIQSQGLIDQAIPSYTERVHVTLQHGKVQIVPLPNHTFAIRESLKNAQEKFASFVAMTSGVDVHCLQSTGFKIDTVLEYRTVEARDKNDLTETGALNVLANSKPRLMLNEDITRIEWDRVASLMDAAPPISLLHLSLQCDDFTQCKANSLKERSISDLSTSRDLVYDGLRLIETVRPATIVLEQVTGFGKALEGDLMRIKLQRWGYHVTDVVMSGMDYDSTTRRERYYLIASLWPGFEAPAPEERRTSSIWPLIERHLENCRDVSHTKSVADGIKTGRIRLITKDTVFAPTVTKSQNRQAKDSVYIEHEGRYYLPNLDLLKALNDIPADFNMNVVSETIASEIVGQSIAYGMHEKLMKAVYEHIADNVGHHTVVNIKREPKAIAAPKRILTPTGHSANDNGQLGFIF